MKLTPNVTDVAEIARGRPQPPAPMRSRLINTLLGIGHPTPSVAARSSRAVWAGLSGPAVKAPWRCAWYGRCTRAVDVPLLGMGGISNATDAVEFMLAGATGVAVGTANFVNPHAHG